MEQQKIQLRKIRDFGENLGDTFQFIKQQFKPLALSFTMVGVAFAIIMSLLTMLYRGDVSVVQENISTGNEISYTQLLSVYNGTFFLIMAMAVIAFSAMVTCIAVYMKYYDEHNSSPAVSDIWSGFLKYFFRTAVLGIMHSILFAVGFIFCFLPGFYFLFVLMPFAFIVVNEDLSVGQAFSRCFELIRENFWISAAIYFVVGMVVFIMSLAVVLVIELITGAGSLFSMESLQNQNPVVDIVQNVLQYYFYIIIYVSIGLHYYNLAESKDGSGIARRLNSLGGNINPNESIEEQY